MDDPSSRQARFNTESRDQWDGFEGHRRRVSALLGAGAPPGPTRLCVLGVGNGNDLDLPALADVHREVHLVDLDAGALDRGVIRQGLAGRAGLHRHGGLDVTGMFDAIARWFPIASITDPELAALVEWPALRVGPALPGPFDLVASTCLLSQIIGNASHFLGAAHPRFAEVVGSIRRGHLRLLAHLTRPGGRFVLITDVVSTDHEPLLFQETGSPLSGLLARLARRGGLIHGVNPAAILADFRTDPALSARVVGLESKPPWLWSLHDRRYLVTVITGRVIPA